MNYNRLNDILQLISDHTSFLILIHDKPDGDALGSGTALALFLKKLGKESAVLSPCPFQKRLELFVDDHNAFDLVFFAFFHELNAFFRVIQRESLRDQRF